MNQKIEKYERTNAPHGHDTDPLQLRSARPKEYLGSVIGKETVVPDEVEFHVHQKPGLGHRDPEQKDVDIIKNYLYGYKQKLADAKSQRDWTKTWNFARRIQQIPAEIAKKYLKRTNKPWHPAW